MGSRRPSELDVTTAHSKDDQMALPQDAFLGNGAGHAAGSTHAPMIEEAYLRRRPQHRSLPAPILCAETMDRRPLRALLGGRGLRTCPWARLVIRVSGVRLHSS